MKRIGLIGLIGLMALAAGCATVNEEGTDFTTFGRILDWAKIWHGSEAEIEEPDAFPYAGVVFSRPAHPPRTKDRIEYKDNIPQTWVPDRSQWLRKHNVTLLDYPEFPDFQSMDITDADWGAGEVHMIRTMQEFERDRRNYHTRVRREDGRVYFDIFKSYGDRIE
jgi:hypothetical protein